MMVSILGFVCALMAPAAAQTTSAPASYRAGVASVVITPAETLWAGGYASRTNPISEKLQDLYAKALVIEDGSGHRQVIVTTDLLGLPRQIADPVAERIGRELKIPRAAILLNSSHTHCGPVLRETLVDIYPMKDEDWAAVRRYSSTLQEQLVQVVLQASRQMRPARLQTGLGRATFAINRRENKEPEVIPGYVPKGPVDHDVPVLAVSDETGRLVAVLFAYACHNTVLNFQQWCGDYAGFAQAELEAKHPGAIAMFAQACGGDSNPLPRRRVELAEKYGRQLATAVEETLSHPLREVSGTLAAAYERIELPLADLPTREQLTRQATSAPAPQQVFARRMLRQLDAGEPLVTSYPYPVQVLRLGDRALIVALGGEVVVDYSLRLKRELGRDGTWVLGYCNDVMAYIPSLRVLNEGGYEGCTSMPLYGLPGKWSPEVEERIVAAVHRLVRGVTRKKSP